MAAHDAGVQVICPGCGRTVMQKAMIPVLGAEGLGVGYLCVPCARALMVPPTIAGGGLAVGETEAEAATDAPEAEAATEPGPAATPEPGPAAAAAADGAAADAASAAHPPPNYRMTPVWPIE